jgi:hypothetical protein
MVTEFKPAQSTGAGMDQDHQTRIAHALEYIAVQLGEINARLEAQADASRKILTEELQEELRAATATQKASYEAPRG